MGCCSSKAASYRVNSGRRSVVQLPGIVDPLVEQQKLVLGNLYVSLFVGQYSDAAAKFCKRRAFEVFREEYIGSQSGGGGCEGALLPGALTRTFKRLDREFLQDDKTPAEVRAATGASGLIVVVDYRSQKAYSANLGTAACLVSKAVGSFAAGWSEGELVSQEHTLRNELERRRLQKKAGADKGLVRKAASGVGSDGKEAQDSLKGVTNLTRGIGFGCLKNAELADAYRAAHPMARGAPNGDMLMSAEPTIVSYPLSAQVEHLALCSEGLVGLSSRQDLSLVLHFFEQHTKKQQDKQTIAQLESVHLPTGTPAKVVCETLMHPDDVPNAAEQLLLRALSTAGDALTRRQGGAGGRGTLVGPEQLQALPLSNATSMAETEQLRGSSRRALSRMPRRALHDDLAAVVISLHWTVSLGPLQRGFDAAAVARAAALETHDVERRWALLRMAVDCQRAKRRVILRSWWELVDTAMKDGARRAKAIEQRLWQDCNLTVQVSPAGKVKDAATGRLLSDCYHDLLSGSQPGGGSSHGGTPRCSSTGGRGGVDGVDGGTIPAAGPVLRTPLTRRFPPL